MIKIHSKALKKIMFHALLFGGKNVHSGSFNMVYGVLGGKVINEQVYLEDLCLLEHGRFDTVQVGNKGYGRIEKFMYKQDKKSSFIIGWYCSISNKGNFYNSTNYQNQLNFQMMNKSAIAAVVYPEKFLEKDFRNCFEILRLKDDLSDSWDKLDFEIIDDKLEDVIKDIKGSYQKFFEIFDLEDLDDEYLDNYLDWEDDHLKPESNFDQYNNIPTKMLSNIGITLIKKQDTPKAIKIYKILLKRNPEEPAFYKNIALCHDKLGNYNKSIIYYKKALFYESHDAQDYLRIAEIYAKRRLYRWAIKFLEKTKKRFGDFVELNNKMGVLYSKVKNYKLGLQNCLKSYEFDPENYFTAYNIGSIYYNLRKKDKASEFYRRSVDLNSKYINGWRCLGGIIENSDHRSAIEIYMEGIEKNPDSYWLYYSIGRVLTQNQKFEEAIPYLEESIKRNPNYYYTWANLRHCFRLIGQTGTYYMLLKQNLDTQKNVKKRKISREEAEQFISDAKKEVDELIIERFKEQEPEYIKHDRKYMSYVNWDERIFWSRAPEND